MMSPFVKSKVIIEEVLDACVDEDEPSVKDDLYPVHSGRIMALDVDCVRRINDLVTRYQSFKTT